MLASGSMRCRCARAIAVLLGTDSALPPSKSNCFSESIRAVRFRKLMGHGDGSSGWSIDNLDPENATQGFFRDQPHGPEATAHGTIALRDKFPVPAVDPPQPTIHDRRLGPALDDVIHASPR